MMLEPFLQIAKSIKRPNSVPFLVALLIAYALNLAVPHTTALADDDYRDKQDRKYALLQQEKDLSRQADDLSRDIFELKRTLNEVSKTLDARQDAYRRVNHALIDLHMQLLQ